MITYLSKKQGNRLIFLCWLVYSSAYLGRLNYSASLVQIMNDLYQNGANDIILFLDAYSTI